MISEGNLLLVEETDLGWKEVVDEILRIISFEVEEWEKECLNCASVD
jgi:hypothetical protein